VKKLLAIALAIALALSMLTACDLFGGQPINFNTGGNDNPPNSGNNPVNNPTDNPQGKGGSDYVFNENDEDVIIEFNFEDEEHRQAILAWLKVLLYAEDYYEFIDGEDYDAPFDLDYEGSILPDDAE